MQFSDNILIGTIDKRYKRFLADIEVDGEMITAHTPNTGSMKTCWEKGWKAAIEHVDNPSRKLKYTLHMLHNGKTWIGVNTSITNKLAIEAIKDGTVKELRGFTDIKPEVKVGKSRIDIQLKYDEKLCYVEVKNVTLLGEKNTALFPDAVSSRGLKHLEELISLKKEGHRACMLYIVQREDVDSFSPAWNIDEAYSKKLVEAKKSGVEILVYQCKLNTDQISVNKPLPFKLNL